MFRIKQLLKMFLQNILLPLFYTWYARKPVEKGSILFADAHHDEVPFSMRRVYETLTSGKTGGCMSGGKEAFPPSGKDQRGGVSGEDGAGSAQYRIESFVRDFDRVPYGQLLRYLLRFMRAYATAEYVFICDYYLPVAACRKRPETKVVQLWHSCGLMKKIAYDAGDDIPKGYRGDMFGNYTYLTLSAQVCVPVHARALRITQERIYATGVSRTDYYFDEDWNRSCREAFYERYPQARGKRIALWAPTFRGNAARPRLEGLEEVRRAADALSGEWYFLIKAHPHIDAHGMVSNCAIPTEELLPVADLLITDYSSVMFDYLLYRRPIVLFAPDLGKYEAERGFYIDYHELPYPVAETAEELRSAVENCARVWREKPIPKAKEEAAGAVGGTDSASCSGDGRPGEPGNASDEEIDRFREKYVGACDGHATERILKLVGLWQ